MNILRTLSIAMVMMFATNSAVAQQRLSLADRVAKLEQQAQPQGQSQANVELLNKMNTLQSEIQALRAQVEELQNENTQLKERNRAQYVDLDTRLQRIEGGAKPAASTTPPSTKPATTPSATKPSTTKPATPATGKPAGSTPVTSADPAAEQSSYDNAYRLLIDEKQYADAARAFQAFLQQYPQSRLASNAWYWMGESYYVTQNYQYAVESFTAVINAYPDSRKLPDAMFKRGLCEIALGQKSTGETTLRDVIQRYPNHPVAPLARDRLQSLSLQR
jgi:tol-pal system protein YbgF